MHSNDWSSDVCSADLRRTLVQIEQRDLRAGVDEAPGDGGADGAARAGHRDDPAGHPLLLRRSELGLLQRPVLDLEGLGLGDRVEPADRLGVGAHRDVVLVDVGRDGVRLRALADGKVASSEEHTSELQSLMRYSYAVFCLKK